jgi:adenylate cyclase class 2
MRYEVEMKFPVENMEALEARLAELGAAPSAPKTELDVYFAHPAKNFAETDEALRIRRKDDQNFITYKGPKLHASTKTRHEIDLPLPPGESTAQSWTDLLQALGFTIAGQVQKSRRKAHVDWQSRRVEVSLDEIAELGCFVELELVVDSTEMEPAQANILSLAAELALQNTERRSYLELLLAHHNNPPSPLPLNEAQG